MRFKNIYRLCERMNRTDMLNRRGEQGSALIYILIAIALLALLTVSFMEPSSQQTGTQNTFKLVSEMKSQIDMIRSAAQECIIAYPKGDNGLDPDNGLAPRTPAINQLNQPYPLNPNSDYFQNCVSKGPDSDTAVSHLRCPGNPADDPCHAPMFGGMTGKFLPPAPAMFEEWQWSNGADGVFFWISSDKSDAFITTALSKLDEAYSACEADVVAASGALGNGISCPASSQCFRIWMLRKTSC